MKRLIYAAVLIVIILLTASHALASETFPSRVVGVVDGDPLRVSRKEGGTLKVRLYGIDCPEKKQAFGARAKQFTSRLAFGKEVRVIDKGPDRFDVALDTHVTQYQGCSRYRTLTNSRKNSHKESNSQIPFYFII